MAESAAAQAAIEALTSFLHTESLLDLAYRFSATYSDLARKLTEHSPVTSVTTLRTGKEKGQFLCIDLDGSSLRVGFVELLGDSEDNAVQSTESGIFGKIKRSCDKIRPMETIWKQSM
jgi:hexokinase